MQNVAFLTWVYYIWCQNGWMDRDKTNVYICHEREKILSCKWEIKLSKKDHFKPLISSFSVFAEIKFNWESFTPNEWMYSSMSFVFPPLSCDNYFWDNGEMLMGMIVISLLVFLKTFKSVWPGFGELSVLYILNEIDNLLKLWFVQQVLTLVKDVIGTFYFKG